MENTGTLDSAKQFNPNQALAVRQEALKLLSSEDTFQKGVELILGRELIAGEQQDSDFFDSLLRLRPEEVIYLTNVYKVMRNGI